MTKKMKTEMFRSKSEMRRHEKSEGPKKVAAEKKAGEKDMVSKKSAKKSAIKVLE